MAEILGAGVTHYGSFYYPDEDMVALMHRNLESPRIPAEAKEFANWPKQAQEEWGQDGANVAASAASHRKAVMDATLRVRDAIDAFKPDFVLIWGDDQYENFHEDLIPPFCVFALDEVKDQPFVRIPGYRKTDPGNVWGEPRDKTFTFKGHRDGAKHLTRQLMEEGFDIPYSYTLHHAHGLAHAFRNTVLYLDYDRRGWDYPIIPFHVNCYGSSLIKNRGGAAINASSDEEDPPAPSPKRCFELGAAVARVLRASPYRAVVIGSSSWSHAFLTKKTHYMWPDVASDTQRNIELSEGAFGQWKDLTLAQLEDAGEHELLNWICLAGAMSELRSKPEFVTFEDRYIFNSTKTVALFSPA